MLPDAYRRLGEDSPRIRQRNTAAQMNSTTLTHRNLLHMAYRWSSPPGIETRYLPHVLPKIPTNVGNRSAELCDAA
ncbi:hypothetical protein IFM12275_17020 [Nocardia sputorum]|uniref:Uncharacterized protein n=1 Tax=Nocardia sputorum TaxID=2984338 RepID=A0ABN6U4U0_9NOCA|nr:hypothetical protein IFM12275_17020 [Nocardia sputorum]BDU00253.1 hypothetical protein IFM12276_32810 [Nocardia sputorum]